MNEFKVNDVVVINCSKKAWVREEKQKDAFAQLGLVVEVDDRVFVLHGFYSENTPFTYTYTPDCLTNLGEL